MGENRRVVTIEIRMRGPYTRVVTKEHRISGEIDAATLIPIHTYTKTITRRESRS